jgi:hypothetical protein
MLAQIIAGPVMDTSDEARADAVARYKQYIAGGIGELKLPTPTSSTIG